MDKKTFPSKNRFLAWAMIFAFIVGITPPDCSAAFSDVSVSHENSTAIEYLQENNILNGYADGTFRPDNTINRAEFTKIIVGAVSTEEQREAYNDESCFSDIPAGEWYTPYVCYAKAESIVKGYNDGTFKPSENINFAEASKIITKGYGHDLEEGTDTWYENYVKKLGETRSIPLSISSFSKKITRGDMSEMIYRLKANVENAPSLTYAEMVAKELDGKDLSDSLALFGSCTDLKKIVAANTTNNAFRGEVLEMEESEADFDSVDSAAAPQSKSISGGANSADDSGAEDFSETNIQVEGVDEADIVKNDGKYIYMIKGDEVRIVQAYPAEDLLEIGAVKAEDSRFRPQEMFLNGDQLIVVGSTYEEQTFPGNPSAPRILPIEPYFFGSSKAAVLSFDISDRSEPKLERSVKYDGDYRSSRRVNDTLYLVLNKYVYTYGQLPEAEDLVPRIKDSATGEDEYAPVCDCEEIAYFPEFHNTNYLMVSAVPLDNPKGKIETQVVLGSSENVYASPENLYVAQTQYDYGDWGIIRPLGEPGGFEEELEAIDEETSANSALVASIAPRTNEETTKIFKWSLNKTDIDFQGEGEVPGRVLNQFSMDEYNGFFRVATTLGNLWDEANPATNNLYILDDELEQVGEIEEIAPGEKIYSVRFMGRKVYMVTFRNVDPLFVIDASNPRDPKILGKLKIPGYSDYLHPYDENHIIGIGKEAVPAKLENGEIDPDFAWYQGMKIAMFDVSDVQDPKQKFTTTIGDRGTSSEVLRNHKALLFDKDKNLMAFPVTVHEVKDKEKEDPSSFGEPVFQGAYVYNIDLEDGFTLRGKITHLSDDTLKKAGYRFYDYGTQIQRILYIGEFLYTVSQNVIKASTLDTVEEVNSVELKKGNNDEFYDDVVDFEEPDVEVESVDLEDTSLEELDVDGDGVIEVETRIQLNLDVNGNVDNVDVVN